MCISIATGGLFPSEFHQIFLQTRSSNVQLSKQNTIRGFRPQNINFKDSIGKLMGIIPVPRVK